MNETSELYVQKLTSIMTIFSPQFDITQLTYDGSKNNDQFGAAYNYTMPSIYRPHDRPWYQEHLKAITTLTDDVFIENNGEFDGVVAKFPQIPQEDASYGQPLIVDEEGKLLTTVVNGKRADSLNSIFTTNFTGFTEEDWSNLKSISSPNIFQISILFFQLFIHIIKLQIDQPITKNHKKIRNVNRLKYLIIQSKLNNQDKRNILVQLKKAQFIFAGHIYHRTNNQLSKGNKQFNCIFKVTGYSLCLKIEYNSYPLCLKSQKSNI